MTVIQSNPNDMRLAELELSSKCSTLRSGLLFSLASEGRQNVSAGVRYQGNFPGMFKVFDFQFPLEGGASISNFLNINQFRWSVHAGVASTPPGVMLFEPAKGVSSPAGVIAAVGTQEHIAIV